MGPRSDNRGYVLGTSRQLLAWQSIASMGPRSDNRGYAGYGPVVTYNDGDVWLQWVHGRITVVMDDGDGLAERWRRELQWVHGRITVVMLAGKYGLR